MADIRCPMCGQENRDELEICENCQARLKPLIVNSNPESSLPTNNLADAKNDDRSGNTASSDPSAIKDWLARIRDDSNVDSLEDNRDDDYGHERIENISDEKLLDDVPPETMLSSEIIKESDDRESEGGIPTWLSELGNDANQGIAQDSLEDEAKIDSTVSEDSITESADTVEKTKLHDLFTIEDVSSTDDTEDEGDNLDWLMRLDDLPVSQDDIGDEAPRAADEFDGASSESTDPALSEKIELPKKLAIEDVPSIDEDDDDDNLDWLMRLDDLPISQEEPEDVATIAADESDDAGEESADPAPALKAVLPDWFIKENLPSTDNAEDEVKSLDWLEQLNDPPVSQDEIEDVATIAADESDDVGEDSADPAPALKAVLPDWFIKENLPSTDAAEDEIESLDWLEQLDDLPISQEEPEDVATIAAEESDDSSAESTDTASVEKVVLPERFAIEDVPSIDDAEDEDDNLDWLEQLDDPPISQDDIEDEVTAAAEDSDDSSAESADTAPAVKAVLPDWFTKENMPSSDIAKDEDGSLDWLEQLDDLQVSQDDIEDEVTIAANDSDDSSADSTDTTLSEKVVLPERFAEEESPTSEGAEDEIEADSIAVDESDSDGAEFTDTTSTEKAEPRDWLTPEEVPSTDVAGDDDNSLDWLKRLDNLPTSQDEIEIDPIAADESDSDGAESTDTTSTEKDELRDWFTTEDVPSTDVAGDDDDSPDWRKRLDNLPTSQDGIEDDATTEAEESEDLNTVSTDRSSAEKDDPGNLLTTEEVPSSDGKEDDIDLLEALANLDSLSISQEDILDKTPLESEISEDLITDLDEANLDEKVDIPNWLASIGDPPQSLDEHEHSLPSETNDTIEDPSSTPISGKVEIPNWLTSIDDGSSIDGQSEKQIPQKRYGFDESSEEIDSDDQDEKPVLPDWLIPKDTPTVTDGAEGSSKETDKPPFSDRTDLPDWLVSPELSVQQKTSKEDEIPEWLESDDNDVLHADVLPTWVGDEIQEVEPSEIQESGGNDLIPSTLPTWLEDLRPMKVVGKEVAGTNIPVSAEIVGPLAGLSGVLRAEPEIDPSEKLPVYSSNLEVSERQLKSASILEKLINLENAAQAVPITSNLMTEHILRWFIAAILFAVGCFAIIRTTQPNKPLYQGNIPDEVIRTGEQIFALTSDDKVLVAFDYEPGTSGEINTAAVPVLDHIMLQGAQMILISTSPTGPALAEQLLDTYLKDHHYLSGHQYVNLGYLPGGASGLLGFSQIPQQITPLSYDGLDAWQTSPLEGISAVSDFSLVVLITDNPDIARTWFEQIQPTLAGTPIVSIISAQAEPILQPYYGDGSENAQMQGLVSGILGGAAYEIITGRPNLASQYWAALNLGLITSIIIVLLGSVIIGTIAVIKRNRDQNLKRKDS